MRRYEQRYLHQLLPVMMSLSVKEATVESAMAAKMMQNTRAYSYKEYAAGDWRLISTGMHMTTGRAIR